MAYLSTCAALLLALAPSALAACESYGLDYEDGGSYFQNINLNETFTLYQEFSGCDNDTAYNVLVDPNGGQSECTNSPLLPDMTRQLVTCDAWTNPELFSGDWALLIVSNNGNGTPIAYQRDFYLDVGVPNVTVTVTPTHVNTLFKTATSYSTTTVTETATSNVLTTLTLGSTSTTSSPSSSPASSSSSTSSSSSSSTTSSHSSAPTSPTSTEYYTPTEYYTSTQYYTSTTYYTSSTYYTSTEYYTSTTYYTPAARSAEVADRVARIVPTVLDQELNNLAASIIHAAESAGGLLQPLATLLPTLEKRHPDNSTTVVDAATTTIETTSTVATVTSVVTATTTTTTTALL